MTNREKLIEGIRYSPEEIVREVFDFYNSLKYRSYSSSNETLFISESSLKKDWCNNEEDEAWKEL